MAALAASLAPALIEAAVPLLTPLIGTLVTHVESLFGAKTGPTKFDVVLNAVTKAASDLSTAGKLPGQLDSAAIGTMIETVVQSLNAANVLNPNIKPSDSLPRGGTFTVSGTLTLA
jgi:hypothetical protein